MLRRLEEKVKTKLQEKILQERSLVEDHVRKMERFGGKNKIANEKVVEIKARDQEVLEQTAKIEAHIQRIKQEKQKVESSVFDYASVETEILVPYSAIHEKVAKLMAKEEALGETIEILKRGPKD